jgi:hypothetical protein
VTHAHLRIRGSNPRGVLFPTIAFFNRRDNLNRFLGTYFYTKHGSPIRLEGDVDAQGKVRGARRPSRDLG